MVTPISQIQKKIIAAFLYFLLVALVFGRATQYPLLSSDDGIHLYQNSYLKDEIGVNTFKRFWMKPYMGLYIPVMYSFWALASEVSLKAVNEKFNAPFFHALSLVLHALNAFLVFLILFRFGFPYFISLIAPLFFAFHPIQAESVLWVSAQKDLLSSFWGLLCVYFLMGYFKYDPRKRDLNFSFLFYVLAVLTKPSLVFLPVGLFLISFLIYKKKLLILYGWFLLVIPIYFITRWAQPEWLNQESVPWLLRPYIAWNSILFYLNKIILLGSFTLNYGFTPKFMIANGLFLKQFIIFIFFSGILWRVRKNSYAILGLFLFLLSLLPTLGFSLFYYQKYSNVADRFAYFSLFGLCLLLAYTLRVYRKPIWNLFFILWIVVLLIKTNSQIPVWSSDLNLMRQMVKVNPTAENHAILASYIKESSGAKYHYRESLRLDPLQFETYLRLGNVYYQESDYSNAQKMFLISVILNSTSEGWNNLGSTYALQGNVAAALESFLKAKELNPISQDAQLNLAKLHEFELKFRDAKREK